MKSYLSGAVLGIALTAAAVGYGAATAHAADYTSRNAGQVAAELQAMGYSVQENGAAGPDCSATPGAWISEKAADDVFAAPTLRR